MRKPKKMPLAFSYLRFSSPEQGTGDSARRQTAATEEWCRRRGAQLDSSISLRDEGVSAFKGKNRTDPDIYALAGFMQAVKTGRVPAGSYLVVESLDRLSREKIRPALTLLLNLIEAGVKVVQLIPAEAVYDEDVDAMVLLQAIMELNRGHSESKVKSERIGAAWARKRTEAATRVATRRLPGWIRAVGGEGKEIKSTAPGEVRFVLDPAKAATVRRIFAMAREGLGVQVIARTLNAEKVPTLGRATIRERGWRNKAEGEYKTHTVTWNETVVYHVLKSRATFGEFQPSKGRGSDRQPVGDPIDNYFPVAVDRDTFLAAQTALKSRSRHGAGRRGAHVNLFGGLLRDARDGGSFTYKHLGSRPAAIIPVGAKQGRGSLWSSFPARPLEDAILSKLREVTVADVRGASEAAKKVEALAGRLAEVEGLVRAWEAKMDNPAIVDTVAAKLAELNGKRKRLAAELADVQREVSSPLSEAWGEARGLLDLLAEDQSDDLRVKVRAALRRSIESVTCLFAGAGRTRLAAVRVQFRGDTRHRDYLIAYEPGRSNHRVRRPGEWSARSFADAGLSEFDLRNPAHAKKLEAVLAQIEVAAVRGED